MITNINDLAEHMLWGRELGHATPFEVVGRLLYKYTECGAWIEESDTGVVVGSIVEGLDDWGATPRELSYPFSKEDFWAAVQAVEDEVDEIWDQTHGCGDCGPEDEETGYRPVRFDCPTCAGLGIVF